MIPHEVWEYIRRRYESMMPGIVAAKGEPLDPHVMPFDWERLFTPIELWAWQEIRKYGIPLYPQFPALGYFIDFANPSCKIGKYKIGLELDGREFHERDKDLERDRRLHDEGWVIFRVTGSEAHNGEDLNAIVAAIGEFYFPRGKRSSGWNHSSIETLEDYREILSYHTFFPEDIPTVHDLTWTDARP